MRANSLSIASEIGRGCRLADRVSVVSSSRFIGFQPAPLLSPFTQDGENEWKILAALQGKKLAPVMT